MATAVGKFLFAIDRGGTFTDVFAKCPDGRVKVLKLLSVDPRNYKDAPTEGIRRILESVTGKKYPQNEKINTANIEWIRMGTTVATNALLERKGQRMALVVNKGLKDVIFIGNQTRPKIFDLNIVVPDVLYEEIVEVDESVFLDRKDCLIDKSKWRKVIGTTEEHLFVERELDEHTLIEDLKRLRNLGIDSLAVALMHSYTFREHEERVEEIAKELGFRHVSLSSKIMPMVRLVPRGFTACVDGYLTPCIKQYLEGFSSGFEDNLNGVKVSFMQSDGGLTPMSNFNGSRAILSGPAGGVVGYARTAFGCGGENNQRPVIGFDMGGTSTDVSRFGGEFTHVFETITAGVTIQAPQLDINTVAAGGGSRLFFRSGLFVVGPESAGGKV